LSWHRTDPKTGALLIAVQAQPNAKRTEVAGPHGDALRIRLAAPPLEGRANDCLVAFVAERLGVKRGAVSVVQGETSRRKLLAVTAAARAEDLYRD